MDENENYFKNAKMMELTEQRKQSYGSVGKNSNKIAPKDNAKFSENHLL